MHNQQHPDLEQLDRLRAGLLDQLPQEKARLEAHLTDCGACRAQYSSWAQLAPGALGPRLEPAALGQDLRAARARALTRGRSLPQRHAFAPYATAALLLLAVTVGIWTGHNWLQPEPQLGTQASAEVPDLYEDLDFYLWLADQNESRTETPNSNPNNT